MPNLPTRYDADQQDLERVKWGHYVVAGFLSFVTIATIAMLCVYGSGYMVFFPLQLFSIISTALYAYANYRSGKAIAQRTDAPITYFVAGVNTMLFPFGTALSWYTWNVMMRPGVQQIYAEHAVPITKANDKPRLPRKPKLVEMSDNATAPEIHWADAAAHVDDAEERLWAEIEAKAKAQSESNSENSES